jgi:hypothetical protein
MAARRGKRTVARLPKELRDEIKRMRKHEQMVYVDAAGNLGAAPMQRGAKKGHRGRRGTCPGKCR